MHFHRLLYGFSILLFFVACTTEIKLARNIQKEKQSISVLCDYPDFLYLSSSMVAIPKGLTEDEETAFHDSLFTNSDYVRFIDDTIFFRRFRQNMKEDLESIGVKYYETDDIDAFLNSGGVQYLVNFKQLEIEERWESYHAEEVFGEMLYEEDFWIKGVSVNAWMDVAKVNDTVEIQRQLYRESVILDEVDGMFFQNQWNGEVHYQYRLDSLEVSDIGELKEQSAMEFSRFIFNYIVNKEIQDRLFYLEGLEPPNNWYISPSSGRLIPNPK